MAAPEKALVTLRGSEAYARFLDRLETAVRSRGVDLPAGRCALAEYALAVLATHNKIKAPVRRQKPRGRPRKDADAKSA